MKRHPDRIGYIWLGGVGLDGCVQYLMGGKLEVVLAEFSITKSFSKIDYKNIHQYCSYLSNNDNNKTTYTAFKTPPGSVTNPVPFCILVRLPALYP
jgi:hypothetical protein